MRHWRKRKANNANNMAYKIDRIKIAHTPHDRRIKLSEDDRQKIRKLYRGGKSLNDIAKIYGVSKSTIHNAVRPEMYQRQLEQKSKKQVWKMEYDRVSHNTAQRKTRRYKNELYKEGVI